MSQRTLSFLLVTLFLSAFALVDVRSHYLLLFTKEDRLMSEKDALHVEWGRLLLEQGTLAEHRRIDHVARQKLDMMMPDPRRIVLLYSQPTAIP